MTDPNELVERWIKRARRCGHPSGEAFDDCADELSDALTWHPMTDEPKGGGGVRVLIETKETDEYLVISEWRKSPDGWSVAGQYGLPLSWQWLSESFLGATWCYLPRRKNDD